MGRAGQGVELCACVCVIRLPLLILQQVSQDILQARLVGNLVQENHIEYSLNKNQ